MTSASYTLLVITFVITYWVWVYLALTKIDNNLRRRLSTLLGFEIGKSKGMWTVGWRPWYKELLVFLLQFLYLGLTVLIPFGAGVWGLYVLAGSAAHLGM